MSGLAAAKTLHKAGYHNLQIIEASGRVGGRIHDAPVGDTVVELGAMWIYGRGSNPVYQMATDVDLVTTDSFVDNWTVRDDTGANVTYEAGKAYERVQRALHNLNEFVKTAKREGGQDLDVSSGIRHFDWLPMTTVDDVIEAYSLDFETGVQPSALSSFNLVFEETYDDFGSTDMLAVTDERGFACVLRGMCNSFLETDDSRLLLNKTVERIFYSDKEVQVFTESGEVFSGDFVVVTFSLGVLQQREVKFDPPLPDYKQMSIDKFGMSSYSHVYVQYPYTFWDPTMYILYACKRRGRFSVWQNMNVISPSSNILQLSLFAGDSEWAERSSDVEIIDAIQEVLQTMYPDITVPRPTDYQISRWNSNPLFRGGFSYWPAAFTAGDMDTLRAPVGRLYFAGEHLHPVHYGFVHGAYLTGVSAAEHIIQCIRRNDSTCDSNASGFCQSNSASVLFLGPCVLMQKSSLTLIYFLLVFFVIL